MNAILDTLPMGATGRIVRQPLLVDVPDLGPEHEGYHIVIERSDKNKSIRGKLDQVYPGANDFTKIAVVDGRAHAVQPFEIAQLTDDWS